MHNIQRKEFTTATLDEISRYVDDSSYNIWVPASTYRPNIFSTVAPTTGQLYGCFVWILAGAAADSCVVCTIRRPSTWTSGSVRTTLYYTGDVANNNYYVYSDLNAYQLGDIASAPGTSVGGGPYTIPSQTAIHKIASYSFQESLAVSQQHLYMTHGITRYGTHGSDSNTGDMYLIGALFTYTEGNRIIGLKTS